MNNFLKLQFSYPHNFSTYKCRGTSLNLINQIELKKVYIILVNFMRIRTLEFQASVQLLCIKGLRFIKVAVIDSQLVYLGLSSETIYLLHMKTYKT